MLGGSACLARQGFLYTAQDLLTQHRADVGSQDLPSLQAQLRLRIHQVILMFASCLAFHTPNMTIFSMHTDTQPWQAHALDPLRGADCFAVHNLTQQLPQQSHVVRALVVFLVRWPQLWACHSCESSIDTLT